MFLVGIALCRSLVNDKVYVVAASSDYKASYDVGERVFDEPVRASATLMRYHHQK